MWNKLTMNYICPIKRTLTFQQLWHVFWSWWCRFNTRIAALLFWHCCIKHMCHLILTFFSVYQHSMWALPAGFNCSHSCNLFWHASDSMRFYRSPIHSTFIGLWFQTRDEKTENLPWDLHIIPENVFLDTFYNRGKYIRVAGIIFRDISVSVTIL